MINKVVIHNKTYTICDFYGQVIDTSKQRETKVTGSGGGGVTWDGYGANSDVKITSTTTLHTEFYLLHESGREEHFKFTDWDISARIGHTLQIFWVIPPNQSRGPYVVAYNKNLNEYLIRKSELYSIAGQHYFWQAMGSYGLVIVIAYVMSSFWVLLFGLVGVWYFWTKKKCEIYAILESEIKQGLLK